MKKQTLPIQGMHCASCAANIQRILKKQPGVDSCEVNYGTEKATLQYDETKTNPETLSKKIEPLGYSLINPHTTHAAHTIPDGTVMTGMDHSEHLGLNQSKEQKRKELAEYRQKVLVALPIALAVFAIMLWEIVGVKIFSLPEFFIPMSTYNTILLVVATPILFWIGSIFLKGMFTFFRHGVANMDTLVGIGTFTAYAYSAMVILFPGLTNALRLPDTVFFDVTLVVIGFVYFGKFLEIRSKIKTGEALEKLMQLQAKTALVIKNGKETETPIEQVQVGDLIVVKPGGKLPLDGVITEGTSSIDESMITGEYMPVSKTVGDNVVGGTLNKQGHFIFKATKVGDQTLLSRIVKMVEEAQGSKAPIQNLADKISAIFVPIVLVIAFTSLAAWLIIGSQFIGGQDAFSYGLLSFVSVLIIACPCALGLATPTAIIVGVGKGATHGILVKNAESLEKLRSVNVLVVDKTGTLTLGKPEVSDIVVTSQNLKEGELLSLAATLEHKSEHPIAHAISEKARQLDLPLDEAKEFNQVDGRGVQAIVKDSHVFAGSPAWAIEKGLQVPSKQLDELTGQGKTPVVVFSEKELFGILAIADTLKPESAPTVSALGKLGVEVVMLTGDNQKTANYIAGQVGIKTVRAQMLPHNKAEVVKEFQAQGKIVAMAGDGINDAPALAQADVGIAMDNGTDIAIETADITLLKGDISKALSAIRLARMTVRTIKQNLFWAFVYNLVGIPLAAGALYPLFGWLLNPAFAGAAMALSSVSVVINSLLLKNKKI